MTGDASETAIFNFIFKFDDPNAIRKSFPKIVEIPFNSVNKFQVSSYLHKLFFLIAHNPSELTEYIFLFFVM